MKLKPIILHRRYCIEVPLEGMIRLLERERKLVNIDDMLSTKIDDYMGVFDSNYDGHFGAYVFYTVEDEYDCPELHANIVKLVEEYIAPDPEA